MASYYLNFNSPTGIRLITLNDFVSADWVRVEKQLGKATFVVPLKYFPLISEYCQIEIWRSVGSAAPYLEGETVWIILDYQPFVTESGEFLLQIWAVDSILVLFSRIVAYYSGLPQTKKAGFAGNVIKEIGAENIGSAANDYTGTANTGLYPRGIPANYFSIQANLNDGASIDNSFAWANCLDAMNDIADMSATAGTYLGFDVVYDGISKLELRTYSGQRGVDHSLTGPSPIILSPNSGNLGATNIKYSYMNESNFIYAGGQDVGTNRKMAFASAPSRLSISPLARREKWQDARQVETTAQVQDQADAALRENKGMIIFSSQIIETANCRYGIEYNFGDKLPCDFLQRSVVCRLNKIQVTVSGAQERILATLQSVA